MRLRNALIVIAAGCCAASLLAKDARVQMTLDIQYFQCVRPATPRCVAFTEDEVRRCPDCKEWGQYFAYREIAGAIPEQLYVNSQKSGTQFIHDVLVEFYNIPPQDAVRYTPPTVAALYDNPGKFGWLEVPWPKRGCIVLDRHVPTYALTDVTPPRRRGPITTRRVLRDPKVLWQVLYPSAKHEGALRTTEGRYVFQNTPKSLFPDFVIDATTPEVADPVTLGWNTWFESHPGPTFRPVAQLRPNTTYDLMVHLSPYGYEKVLVAQAARPEVINRVMYMGTRTAARAMRLTALVLPDDEFLHGDVITAHFDVDLDRFRRWKKKPSPPPGDPLSFLAANGDPSFVFGEVSVPLTTTSREGTSYLGVSIWDENAWPIDEITLPVCIAASEERAKQICSATKSITTNIASFEVARPRRATKPDAALHFLSVGPSSITGVFHRNDVKGAPYFAWRTGGTEADFTERAAAAEAQAADARYSQEELSRAGKALYDAVFAVDDAGNAAAHRAQTMFEAFARPHLLRTPSTPQSTPALFVRFVTTAPSPRRTRILPLALAKAPLAPEAYLGFHFRMETPLPRQAPAAGESCIQRWRFLLPPENNNLLGGVRKTLDVSLASWLQHAKIPESMDDARSWIDADADDDEPTALAMLGHYDAVHGNGELTWGPHETLRATEIHRRFAKPSVAILNGCGTGESAALDFISVLNEHGIDTIIATAHAVTSDLATEYFAALASELGHEPRAFGDAHFAAVQALRARQSPTGQPYGAAALAYQIVGDPSIMVCQPQE